MNEQTADKNKASITVEYHLSESPAKVWRALTDAEVLGNWLMPNDIRPEKGRLFTFRSKPIPGWDGIVHCEVLEVISEQRLVYSWRGGSDDVTGYGHELDTVVAWTLTPTADGGTRLELQHSGFDPESPAFQMLGQGWRGKVATRLSEAISAAA